MTPYDFAKIAEERDLERALEGVFEEAHEKWTDERMELNDEEVWTDEQSAACLTEGQITVLVVETYFGEVLNGGHYQYLSNESGGLANFAPAVLRRVGLGEFAPVIHAFISLFPNGKVPEDADERQEALDSIAESHDDEFLEGLDTRFFDLCPEGHEFFRAKLVAYVINHEDQFVND